jgi:hypothetical protein
LGDCDIALGSIIVPAHVICRASSAHTAMVVKPRIIGINMIVRNIDVPLCFAFRLPPAPRERAIGDTWLAAGARFFAKAPRPNHHFGQRRRI